MRRLSERQVKVCETADKPRCRCRCGGAYHGAKRSDLPEYYEGLPEQDPHNLPRKSRQLRLPAPVGSEA